MFSARLPRLETNAFSLALAHARGRGARLFDLTETNPTRIGLRYPEDLLSSLSTADSLTYRPEPRGLRAAREAVAAEYARSGTPPDPDRIVLAAGTSDAYGLLFKLLCDPGDEVLVPAPSYPLFDLLTGLDAVVAQQYRLERSACWRIDRSTLERAITPRTRAVLVVSPNNPTGSIVDAGERDWLVAVCASRGLALIADEVFADYPLAPGDGAVSMAGEPRVLTFALGGLSKSAGLPQLKLAWMQVSGPDAEVAGALDRLDLICDTYLSVGTPVQVAAASIVARGREVRAGILARLRRNLEALQTLARPHPAATVLPIEGGWSAVLRVPSFESEEALVLRLLDEAQVVAHPGYFFDFDEEAFLIVSLLPRPEEFDEGIRRLLQVVEAPER
jgi:hypothetical protein